MNISKQYVNYKNNAWGYSSMNPTEITIHATANDASAQNERDYVASQLSGKNNGVATFTYVVDEKQVIQLLPQNINGWHAGDGNTGRGNMQSIGIEIARSTGSSEDWHKAEELAAELVASLIKDGTISSVDKIYTHYDRNGKHCPHRMIDEQGSNSKAKTYFKNKVNKYLGTTTTGKPTTSSKDNDITWAEADKMTSTNKYTGTRIKKVRISGKYPSDYYTYGHSAPKLSAPKVDYAIKDYYDGYLVDSGDGIVWVEITSIRGTKGEVIYLDMNPSGTKAYYGGSDTKIKEL